MDKPQQFSAFLFSGHQPQRETFWRPAADIYRIRGGWLLKFDLAGVYPEDVKVEVKGCHVTVSGVRRDMLLEESASFYSMEIAYNRFERTVELPCYFANPAVAIENRNGILIVRLITEEER
ncbi:MAG: Hsp20/alpha crystallin family protein [bacterium]|jgi:HSP20 family molecular chaperone IbpA